MPALSAVCCQFRVMSAFNHASVRAALWEWRVLPAQHNGMAHALHTVLPVLRRQRTQPAREK